MLGSYRRFHSTVFEETTLYGMVVATYRRFIWCLMAIFVSPRDPLPLLLSIVMGIW
jgi:hypothetical protein